MSRNNILGLVFQDYFVGLRQLFNTILECSLGALDFCIDATSRIPRRIASTVSLCSFNGYALDGYEKVSRDVWPINLEYLIEALAMIEDSCSVVPL